LIFEKAEIDCKLNNKREVIPTAEFDKINLNYDIFDKESTIVLKNYKSDFVQLSNGEVGLEVGIKGFTYLAFWCGKRAPFLCIEPWYGIGDYQENDTKFEAREGMMSLASRDCFQCEYYIKLL
jgi:hypothetical protein